jgi:hypothetical protein
LANWIEHKRRLEQQNYSLLRNIRKGISAPTPKHFQTLLKFRKQYTKKKNKISKFFKLSGKIRLPRKEASAQCSVKYSDIGCFKNIR